MVKSAEVAIPAYGLEPGGAAGDAGGIDRPILDLVHLSRQTFGDHALEKELLTLFDGQAAHLAARLSEPRETGAPHWRAELVHTLKGSARSVGAFVLGDLAETYETAVRAGDSHADALRSDLLAAIDAVRAEIAALLEKA